MDHRDCPALRSFCEGGSAAEGAAEGPPHPSQAARALVIQDISKMLFTGLRSKILHNTVFQYCVS